MRLEGGTVSVGGSGDQIYFLWAISRPGYTTVVRPRVEDHSLVVVFSNGPLESRLEAAWVDEELVLDVFEDEL